MRRVRGKILPLAMLAAFLCGPGNATSLSTDVTVSINSSISLFCFDEVNVDLSAGTYLSAISRNRSRPMPGITRTARERNGELHVNGGRRFWNRKRFEMKPRVLLELGSICAYRSVGGSNGARVQVEALETRLEAPQGGYIEIDRLRVRDTEKADRWRRRFRVTPAELGAGVVRGIDVRMRLDMRNATEPGLYSSPTDGTFRITVIENP